MPLLSKVGRIALDTRGSFKVTDLAGRTGTRREASGYIHPSVRFRTVPDLAILTCGQNRSGLRVSGATGCGYSNSEAGSAANNRHDFAEKHVHEL